MSFDELKRSLYTTRVEVPRQRPPFHVVADHLWGALYLHWRTPLAIAEHKATSLPIRRFSACSQRRSKAFLCMRTCPEPSDQIGMCCFN